jgi:hypothetical protein
MFGLVRLAPAVTVSFIRVDCAQLAPSAALWLSYSVEQIFEHIHRD